MRSEKYFSWRQRKNMTRSAFKLAFVSAILTSFISQAQADSLGLTDVGAISCELFLRYTGSNAPDYPVFNAFAEGYIAAKSSGARAEGSAQDLTAVMAAVTQHCRDHADDDFGAVLASVVNGEPAEK